MKTHKGVSKLQQSAIEEQRCIYSCVPSEQRALNRRASNGDLVCAYPGNPKLYAEASYWRGLTPPQRTMHIARALARAHRTWVFGGLVAAVSYGLDHPWCLHDGHISIVTADHGTDRPSKYLRRVYMPDYQNIKMLHPQTGLMLLPPIRTLLDCAHAFDFRFALPIFDSALSQGYSMDDIIADCARTRVNHAKVIRLLRYASSRSDNGGESLARGTMIDEGFHKPRTQVPFRDPQTGMGYRADFVWTLQDGTTIVGEYDGTRKYVDPAMIGNRAIQEVVSQERQRDEGLRRAGVHDIVHFNYDDVIKRAPLTVKLLRAGVPRSDTA